RQSQTSPSQAPRSVEPVRSHLRSRGDGRRRPRRHRPRAHRGLLATGIGGVWTLLDAWDTLQEEGPRRVMPLTVPMLMPNGPAAAIGMEFKARAGVQTLVSACASSTESLGHAYDVLASGKADVIIAGGSEAAIHPITLAA